MISFLLFVWLVIAVVFYKNPRLFKQSFNGALSGKFAENAVLLPLLILVAAWRFITLAAGAERDAPGEGESSWWQDHHGFGGIYNRDNHDFYDLYKDD